MKSRPAETAGGIAAAATAIAAAAGASTTAVAIVGCIAGIVPACVTFLVANGGLRGVVRSLWKGKR